MTLTDRDRKILTFVLPVLLIVAYWFLLLSPKRDEAAKAGEELQQQEQARDAARQQLTQLQANRANFERDYAVVVKLGKAIPADLDMETVLVQLDSAAKGTGVKFTKIEVGERQSAQAANPANPGASGNAQTGTGSSQPPAAAGGQQAQSQPGQAAEAANNASQASAQRNQAAEQSGVNPSDTQTSTSSGSGLPVGGGAAAGGAQGQGAASTASGALDSVQVTLTFNGDFLRLADFFHRLKRFVRVAGDRLLVRGRLLTVESLRFTSDEEKFPQVGAELVANVYLAPKSQGATGGATPQGPAPSTTVSNQATGNSSGTTTPAATAAR